MAGLDRLDLVLSHAALGKEDLDVPTIGQRCEVLQAVAASRPWLGVVVTRARLIVDIADGYEAVVMGADKWRQVTDPAWYSGGSVDARDEAVARLPRVLVVPRAGDRPTGVELVEVSEEHGHVSASAIRARSPQAADWMLPEARAFDDQTGIWTGGRSR